MTKKNHEQDYKQQLENIIRPLLNNFPKHKDFFDLFKDKITASRLSQAVQLYTKIATLNLQLQQEKDEAPKDEAILRKDLIQKVKNLIHP